MTLATTFIFLTLCLAGMGIGFIVARKTLKKGCSTDPDSCACKDDPSKSCENKY